jgi:hypothetical protein
MTLIAGTSDTDDAAASATDRRSGVSDRDFVDRTGHVRKIAGSPGWHRCTHRAQPVHRGPDVLLAESGPAATEER